MDRTAKLFYFTAFINSLCSSFTAKLVEVFDAGWLTWHPWRAGGRIAQLSVEFDNAVYPGGYTQGTAMPHGQHCTNSSETLTVTSPQR